MMVDKFNLTCKDQGLRADGIGRLAAAYDIVALQEVWGSSVEVLQQPLAETHYIHREIKPFPLLSGWLASVANTASFYLQGLGGLSTIWKKVREIRTDFNAATAICAFLACF